MSPGIREGLRTKGKVELFVTKGKPSLNPVNVLFHKGNAPVCRKCEILFPKSSLIDQMTSYNIIVNGGKDKIIESLVAGNINPIGRMAIGDRGTIPSDPTVPKVPLETFSALYSEVHREDIDAYEIDVGTPSVHEVKFIKTFSALEVPILAFSNQTKPVVNEVGLITFNESLQPLPRLPVSAPTAPPADEALFSIRTFKSVPFEAANEISVTIRYTIFID